MKSFLFRIYLKLMKLYAGLHPVKENIIVILNGAGRSGSNGYLFYKWLKENQPNYQPVLVEPWPSSHLPLKTWKIIGQAHYILTTHQPFKIKKSQVSIQLWHGIPLKRMGIMAHNTRRRDNQRNEKLWQTQTDLVASSSDLYESLMSACIGVEGDKYCKVGFPRLDYLKKPAINKSQLLRDLFKVEDEQAQIGIYMPTFRYELADLHLMEQIKAGNFFNFDDFDAEKLNRILKMQHQYLIVKLHPYEMRLFNNLNSQYSNIAFLNNSYLFDHQLDLYELLGNTDFLITDFSSIYFDYLLLDRPIVFVDNYLRQYEKTRGLLISPYGLVTPGPKVKKQSELEKCLTNLDNQEDKMNRQKWLKFTCEVKGSFCQRLFDEMTKVR